MFRVTSSIKRLLIGRTSKWLLAAAAAGAMGVPAVAQAGRYDPPARVERHQPDHRFPDRHDEDRHDDHHDDRINLDIHVGDRPAYAQVPVARVLLIELEERGPAAVYAGRRYRHPR